MKTTLSVLLLSTISCLSQELTTFRGDITTTYFTNISSKVSQHSIYIPCPDQTVNSMTSCLVAHSKLVDDEDPKERWTTTIVEKIETFKFYWNGPKEVQHRTIISSNTVYYVKDVTWIQK